MFFFLIEKVLVPRTSHVKGLHVQTESLPVPDNRTWVLVHPEFVVNNSNDDNNDYNKRYKRSVSEEKGNVEPC